MTIGKSLAKTLILRITVVLLTLLLTLVAGYFYSVSVVRNNIKSMSSNTIQIYCNDMVNSLNNASNALDEIFMQVEQMDGFAMKDQSQTYFMSIELLEVMGSKINYANDADAYFIADGSGELVLIRVSNRVVSEQTFQLTQFLNETDLSLEGTRLSDWNVCHIGKDAYFLKYYTLGSVRVGSFVLADTLMSVIDRSILEERSGYVLTDAQGQILSSVGLESDSLVDISDNYMVISGKMGKASTELSNFIAPKSVFQGMSFIQWGIIGLILLSLLLLLWVFAFLRKEVLRPVRLFIEGTEKVRDGIWDEPVDFSASSNEFEVLKQSFNIMIQEIKHLKIQSYEEKIERQKDELRYLQMQIRPHFYLNALTTVHSLSFKNKNDEIRRFVEALSDHLRYTIRDGITEVTIKEEVGHVREYTEMQEIRFSNSVFFMADVSSDVENKMIPQFLILTFVENAFKHAMGLDQVLSILVQAKHMERGGSEYIVIVIEDNGPGFPNEDDIVIEKDATRPNDTDGKIGITNVYRTLKLFYGEDVSIVLANSEPSGARIEIWIPVGEGQSR